MKKNRATKIKNMRNDQLALRSGLAPKIPQIKSNIINRHTFRFRATAALSAVACTDANILGACGTVGTVLNTSVAVLAKTYRLRGLRMWAPCTTNGTPVTVSAEFLANIQPSVEYSDTSMSTTVPAYLDVKPLSNSIMFYWKVTASTNAFVLTGPSGTIIDVDVEYIMDDDAAILTTATVATAAVGFAYWLALDGPASNLIVPVSLQTTS